MSRLVLFVFIIVVFASLAIPLDGTNASKMESRESMYPNSSYHLYGISPSQMLQKDEHPGTSRFEMPTSED